jgi:hypothetical protein
VGGIRAAHRNGEVFMKRDLLTTKTPEQEKQLDMARNIGQLKDKQSKKQQARMLCQSLVRMIKGK